MCGDIEVPVPLPQATVAAVDPFGRSQRTCRRAARLRFSEGVPDFLQVLDADRTELESQSRLALGRTEAATSYAALYKALGGQ